MNIYVQSAGVVDGYAQQQPPTAPPMPAAISRWHKEIDPEDTYFALLAGMDAGKWYVEFRNLLLPDTYDLRRRRIVLNICFGALNSEAEARALALAYLDFELVYKDDTCQGRYCPQLAGAYSAHEGNYRFDFEVARNWAQGIIHAFAPPAAGQPPICPIVCHTNPATDTYLQRVRDTLSTHSLRRTTGLRLLWAELYTNPAAGADITLQYTTETGSFTQQKPRSRTAPLLWLLLLAVVLVAAGFGAYLYFYSTARSSTPRKPHTPPPATKPITAETAHPEPGH